MGIDGGRKVRKKDGVLFAYLITTIPWNRGLE